MTYEEAIKEAEIQFGVYESMILYNKDFEPKNDNSNYERKIEFLKIAIEALEKQATSEAASEWIPVSERLPNDGETYLITNAESFEQYHTYKGWYDGTKGIWHMTGNFERKMNVIAWMPLPEPYKGESV